MKAKLVLFGTRADGESKATAQTVVFVLVVYKSMMLTK